MAFTYVTAADKACAVAKQIDADCSRVLVIQADNADPRHRRRRGQPDRARVGPVLHRLPLEEATVDQAGRLWAVDVRAVLVASQAAAWNMSEGGRIITMGSALADRVPVPGMTLYAMAKSAFTGLIRAWRAIWPSAGSLSPWYMAASSTPT